jgi:hypothetical protein
MTCHRSRCRFSGWAFEAFPALLLNVVLTATEQVAVVLVISLLTIGEVSFALLCFSFLWCPAVMRRNLIGMGYMHYGSFRVIQKKKQAG